MGEVMTRGIINMPLDMVMGSINGIENYHSTAQSLLADYDALRAENAELKRDAERYRWLRDCHGHDGQKNLTICEVFKWSLEPWSGDDPDRAIDKALAKHRGE